MGKLSYRQIMVGRAPAGMQGLDELFAELYAAGRRPDEAGLGDELVTRARQHNYIPRSASDEFAKALLREYTLYVSRQDKGEATRPRDYGTWRGYPREQVPWFPTIAPDLCDGCGRCLELCTYGVLAATADGRVEVVDPFRCVVGCSSCANVCRPGAITFPPRSILDTFRPRTSHR